MQHDAGRRSSLLEGATAAGLTAIGFAIGSGPLAGLAAVAASIGGNWATTLAQRGFDHWRNNWFTERGALNGDIATALYRAFAEAAQQLERDWQQHYHYLHLGRTDAEAANLTLATVRELGTQAANLLAQVDHRVGIMGGAERIDFLPLDEATARSLLRTALDEYFYGHDQELVEFVQERLPIEWLLRFGELLKDPGPEGTRAWRACQRLWQESLTSALAQLQQTSEETLDTVQQTLTATQWLREWAQRLEHLPATEVVE